MFELAYFTNQYPKVSHSFIRREIQALEKQGIQVARFALRCPAEELADKRDIDERAKTRYILDEGLYVLAKVTVVTALSSPRRFWNAALDAIKIGFCSDRGILRHAVYLAEACLLLRWLKSHGAQHVHAHFGTNSAMVVMLSHQLGGPSFSFTVHGPEEFDKPHFLALGEKITKASFVVAVSSYGRSQLFRWVSLSQWKKVKVVHCGIEPEFYQGDIAPASQVARLVCVGRLCEQKGQLLLVEAVHALAQRGITFDLILAGDGPLRGEVESLIRKYNLSSRVHITGWVSSERIREELEAACVLVLPSFAEGLPVAIMEAMALKRPVVSTYVAGIPELVIPGENGWLVPAGSIEALTRVLGEVLETSQERLLEMGEAASKRACERHDIDQEAAKLASFFRKVCAQENP